MQTTAAKTLTPAQAQELADLEHELASSACSDRQVMSLRMEPALADERIWYHGSASPQHTGWYVDQEIRVIAAHDSVWYLTYDANMEEWYGAQLSAVQLAKLWKMFRSW